MAEKKAENKAIDMAAVVNAKDDQIKAMKKEVEEARAKLTLQATEIAGLKELYEACQEEVKDCDAVFVMRTKAQLMWRYLNGEARLWEAWKEVGT